MEERLQDFFDVALADPDAPRQIADHRLHSGTKTAQGDRYG